MTSDLTFSCSCGALKGHLDPSALQNGLHLACHCQDCRAAALYRGQPDPKNTGGVHLFQMPPDMIHIDQGHAQLKLFRLGPNGLFRWYAGCCGTPIANTLKSAKLPFAAISTNCFADPTLFGKVKAEGFLPTKKPGQSPSHRGGMRVVYAIFSRMIVSRLSGRWIENPFFDIEANAPVSKPEILSKEDRLQSRN